MIDERILVVTGIAVLILVVQGLLHLFLTVTRVYLPKPARPERDSSDDRRVLLEYRTLLRERFHRVFGGSDEPPGDVAVPERPARPRPNAEHGPGTPTEEARARAALIRDRPDPSAFRFQSGMLIWPTLVLLLILSTLFNW